MLRSRTIPRHALALFAGLAIALTLLCPPGFMPGAGAVSPVVICSGHGATGDQAPAHAPCPFSAVAIAPLVPVVPQFVPPAPLPPFAPSRTASLAAAPGRGMAAPPPPSHAPPRNPA